MADAAETVKKTVEQTTAKAKAQAESIPVSYTHLTLPTTERV